MKCPKCQNDFPSELLHEMAIGGPSGLKYVLMCPICALKMRNEMMHLPPNEPFQGQLANRAWLAAKEHLRVTKQDGT